MGAEMKKDIPEIIPWNSNRWMQQLMHQAQSCKHANLRLVKNITAQHIILSSIVETNENEPFDNGNNF